jgi:CheY-specific phosphatase CheX
MQELAKKAEKYLSPGFARAFAEGAQHTMNTTIQQSVKMGQPSIVKNHVSKGDVIGRLSMTDPGDSIQCHLEISFQKDTACYLLEAMLGETSSEISQEVRDVAGEMTNMIYCHARKTLNESGLNFKMAIPQVRLAAESGATVEKQLTFVIPFTVGEKMSLWVEIAIFESGKPALAS